MKLIGCIVLILLSACSVNFGGYSIKKIVDAEKIKYPSIYYPNQEEIKNDLREVLLAYNLHENSARLLVFQNKEQQAYIGIAGDIYISSGLLDIYTANLIPKNYFISILCHEVAHLKAGHTKKRISGDKIDMAVALDPALLSQKLFNMAYIGSFSKGNISLPSRILTTEKVSMLTQNTTSRNRNNSHRPGTLESDFTISVLYEYPISEELEADKMATEILSKMGHDSDSLIYFLYHQVYQYENVKNIDTKKIIKNLQKRIENIQQ